VPQQTPLLLGVHEESDGILGCARLGSTPSRHMQCRRMLGAVRKLTFCACCLRWSFCWLRIGVDGPLCSIASDLSRSIRRRDTLVDEPLNTPHNMSPMDPIVCPSGERAKEGMPIDWTLIRPVCLVTPPPSCSVN